MINRDIGLFLNIFQREEWHARFLGGKYYVFESLWPVQDFQYVDVKELVAVKEYKAPKRNLSAVSSGLHCTDVVVLYQFGTHEIRQLLRVSMVTGAHASKNGVLVSWSCLYFAIGSSL